MIKGIIKKMLNNAGYEIQKKGPEVGKTDKFFKHSEGELDFFDTPTGKFYLPNNAPGDIVIKAMKEGRYFDENIIRIGEKYVKPGTAVLDIGANLGQMSIHFSKLVGQTGKIYSFDADDYIYEIFLKNIKANNCNNIEAIFGAVYNETGKIFYFPKQNDTQLQYAAYGSYGIQPKLNEGRRVESFTIDSLNIKEPVSFIKVDIQGSDLFALQGARETIIKNRAPVIFEYEQQFQSDFNTSFQDYVDFVESISYKFGEVIDDINYLIVPKEK